MITLLLMAPIVAMFLYGILFVFMSQLGLDHKDILIYTFVATLVAYIFTFQYELVVAFLIGILYAINGTIDMMEETGDEA